LQEKSVDLARNKMVIDCARFHFLASKNFARSCTFLARKASFHLQEDNIFQDFRKHVQGPAIKLLARFCLILQDGFYWEPLISRVTANHQGSHEQ